MKSTILSIVLAMLGVAANSQVITVTATTLQKFNHSSSMSTIEAMTLDAINYPSYIVGENVFVFDLNNKSMTLNGSLSLLDNVHNNHALQSAPSIPFGHNENHLPNLACPIFYSLS